MYFITTLHSCRDAVSYDSYKTVGYFEDKFEAINVIKLNGGDIREFYYDYVVLEKIEIGIYNYDLNPTWFFWDLDENKYVECPKPKFAVGVAGWVLG